MAEIKLKQYMEKNNISYRQAEKITGVGKTTLQAIAGGRDPRLSTLELIAKGLSCKITDFVKSEYL